MMVVPSVSQQLAAIRHTIAKTVLPALDPSETFAAEQATLVLASLDWAMDVVESEYRYETVENADQRSLLASLLELGVSDDGSVLLAVDPPLDLTALRDQTRALKTSVERAFVALSDSDSDSDAAVKARTLVSAAARRQTARELAWTRMTGFPRDAPALADVLAEQSEPTST